MTDLRVEWITEPARFREVATAWDALARREQTPFLLHDWLTAWWAAFGGNRLPRICAVWHGEQIVAGLPLMAAGGRLEALANGHTPEGSVLARDARTLETLVEAVLASGAVVVLPRLPARHEAVCAIRAKAGALAVCEGAPAAPWVDTRGAFADYVKRDQWRRKEGMRLVRKTHREHAVRQSLVAAPDDLERGLQAGFELEAGGWKGARGTAILSSPDTERFYRSIAEAFARRGALRLSTIELDGELAAWELCLLHADRLFALKAAYDERFRPLGLGMVLTLAAVERCHELGLSAYELGAGEEAYKRRFANAATDHVTVRVYPSTAAGAIRRAYRRSVRPRARRVYRRLKGRPPAP